MRWGIAVLVSLVLSCSGGPADFLLTSFEAPRTWSLVDEEGRPVEVSLIPGDGGVEFRAGVIREVWGEGAGGYSHADTVELLWDGQVRTWVFDAFLVYPLPPLPGIRRESSRSLSMVWGQDTLQAEAFQSLEVREGPVLHLVRTLKLQGTQVVREERTFQFERGDLVSFTLLRTVQGDTLHLRYVQP